MRKIGKLVQICLLCTCAYIMFAAYQNSVTIRIRIQSGSSETDVGSKEEEEAEESKKVTVKAKFNRHPGYDTTNATIDTCPQSIRHHILDKQCGRRGHILELMNSTANFRFMLVDERLKAIYCAVPKAGSTSWKSFLAKVAGGSPLDHQAEDENYLSNLGLRYLSVYPPSAIQQKLESYFKFAFVRHPLERLVSAYRDKIGRYNAYGDDIRREIVEKVLKNNQQAVSVREAKLTRVTFDTFVKYVISKSGSNQDHHWEDFDKLCHPCQIKYNYIGKLETMDSDSENIITKLQSTVNKRAQYLENLNKKYSYSKGKSSNFKRRLGDFHNVTSSDMKQLEKLYKDDMDKFGYTWDSDGLEATCSSKIATHNCC